MPEHCRASNRGQIFGDPTVAAAHLKCGEAGNKAGTKTATKTKPQGKPAKSSVACRLAQATAGQDTLIDHVGTALSAMDAGGTALQTLGKTAPSDIRVGSQLIGDMASTFASRAGYVVGGGRVVYNAVTGDIAGTAYSAIDLGVDATLALTLGPLGVGIGFAYDAIGGSQGILPRRCVAHMQGWVVTLCGPKAEDHARSRKRILETLRIQSRAGALSSERVRGPILLFSNRDGRMEVVARRWPTAEVIHICQVTPNGGWETVWGPVVANTPSDTGPIAVAMSPSGTIGGPSGF